MRFYDLGASGKVKGHYAVPQPGMVLALLEDAPDDESKRDGVPGTAWIPDQEKIDARMAEVARIAAKTQAIVDNLPSWAQVKTAIDAAFPDAKQNSFMTKAIRIVYWLAKDKEE